MNTFPTLIIVHRHGTTTLSDDHVTFWVYACIVPTIQGSESSYFVIKVHRQLDSDLWVVGTIQAQAPKLHGHQEELSCFCLIT